MDEQAPVVSVPARLIGHAVLAAIGLAALAMALRLGLWRQSSPGEGLFPFITALAMLVFSAAGLARDRHRRAPVGDTTDVATATDARSGLIRVAAYLGALVFYAATLEFLGFIVASAITLIFILRFAERYPWRATLALAAGTVVGCQVLFVLWLGAILPTGTLWESLFG